MGDHPFNDTAFDQPLYEGPTSSYILCTTPRVGGTLLAALLQNTGQMGVPHEYFHVKDVTETLRQRWNLPAPLTTRVYLDYLFKHRTTPNGIFGCKAHFQQITGLLDKPSIIDFIKNNKLFVYVTRKDLMGQAVSYAKAHQTRNWSSLQKAESKAKYDRDLIEKCMDDILAQNARWQKFFALYDIEPLRVVYEDLIINTNEICQEICQRMNQQPLEEFHLEVSPLKQQRDEINAEWKSRYRRDLRSF
ncbi:Stf0 family sulfotransferase [Terasakiella sp. A23]|uniref:Stf0 family sulfotransferase n=1 Tax=Terasakiella sp. FCG-A23 TaxID=3080561 RepID=UPI0029556976|nr:Stf0 family sulfotransferase [Terasakiella sp. A23]MDV7341363.1 Stf0 family sulfotransferase [Terasakiella sp. A23]